MSVREYAKVGPKAWQGSTFKALRKKGPKALVVGLYLMTSPSSNMLGLYPQPILYMAHETGLGEQGAWEALRDCIEVGFCSYDEESEIVWVHEMAKYQIAEELKASDLRCKGIQKEYDSLPENPFLGPFFDRYAGAFHMTRKRNFRGPSERPLEAPTKPGAGAGAGERAGEGTQPATQASARPPAEAAAAGQLPGIEAPPEPPKGLPDCPHLQVLALWAEVLPELPQHDPDQWRGTRADHLRARWRETAATKGWTTQDQGMAYLRKLFGWIRGSAFLMGKVPPRQQGRKQFQLELEWLVSPTNWARVIEGKYHEEATA